MRKLLAALAIAALVSAFAGVASSSAKAPPGATTGSSDDP